LRVGNFQIGSRGPGEQHGELRAQFAEFFAWRGGIAQPAKFVCDERVIDDRKCRKIGVRV